MAAQGLIPHDTLKEVQQMQQANGMNNGAVMKAGEMASKIYMVKSAIDSANWWLILFCFLFLFYRGIPVLFRSFCRGRQRRERGPPGGSVADDAHHPAGDLFLFPDVGGYTGPGGIAGYLGQHYPLQLPDRHDGQNSLWSAWYGALVAIGTFHAVPCPRLPGDDLAGRQDLSDRHFNVWQKGHLEDDVEMGLFKIPLKEYFLPRIYSLTLASRYRAFLEKFISKALIVLAMS